MKIDFNKLAKNISFGHHSTRAFIDQVFAPKDDLRLHSDFGDPRDILSTRNSGIVLDGRRALTEKQSLEGVGIFGQTGSGKSSVSVISTLLLNQSASFLVHDPGRSTFESTAGAKIEQGYKVIVVDLLHANQSSGINVFPKTMHSGQIAKQVDTVVRSTIGSDSGQAFWNLNAKDLLFFLASLVFGLPEQYRHWPQVARLLDILTADPKQFDWLVKHYSPNKDVIRMYKGILRKPPKTMQNVLMTAKASLSIFNDENIAKVMSYRGIDFEAMRKEKTVLYIVNSVASMSRLAPISNLIFTSFFDSVFDSRPKPSDLPIYTILDECSSLNLGRDFANYCNNVRKHNCNITAIYQSENQIAHSYGKDGAQAILSGLRTKLIIPAGMELEVATKLQHTLGQFDYEEEETGHLKRRFLRTATELMQTSPDVGIITCTHHPPMEVKLIPFYKQKPLLRLSEITVPKLPSLIPNGDIPYFNAKTVDHEV